LAFLISITIETNFQIGWENKTFCCLQEVVAASKDLALAELAFTLAFAYPKAFACSLEFVIASLSILDQEVA